MRTSSLFTPGTKVEMKPLARGQKPLCGIYLGGAGALAQGTTSEAVFVPAQKKIVLLPDWNLNPLENEPTAARMQRSTALWQEWQTTKDVLRSSSPWQEFLQTERNVARDHKVARYLPLAQHIKDTHKKDLTGIELLPAKDYQDMFAAYQDLQSAPSDLSRHLPHYPTLDRFFHWPKILTARHRQILSREYIEGVAKHLSEQIKHYHSLGIAKPLILDAACGLDPRFASHICRLLNVELAGQYEWIGVDVAAEEGIKIAFQNRGYKNASSYFEDLRALNEKFNADFLAAYGMNAVFPVRGDVKDVVKEKNPTIVLCSWMSKDFDFTPLFRAQKSVQEYVLIGPPNNCGQSHSWWAWDGFQVKDLNIAPEVLQLNYLGYDSVAKRFVRIE
jgi:hypothetical protein